ncbi:hypothetical protein [Azoarcus sp. DD4]|uniref:hypothetical protein n=1 Tax=Azoarcus sp. DD4 TaxID=2027405 RepID=UPI0011282A6E|nr:hypothetical protein [Azoarcus sp. DD4]
MHEGISHLKVHILHLRTPQPLHERTQDAREKGRIESYRRKFQTGKKVHQTRLTQVCAHALP